MIIVTLIYIGVNTVIEKEAREVVIEYLNGIKSRMKKC
jgi:hypothetical protein